MLHKIGRDATVKISRFEVFCLDRFVRNALSFASILFVLGKRKERRFRSIWVNNIIIRY